MGATDTRRTLADGITAVTPPPTPSSASPPAHVAGVDLAKQVEFLQGGASSTGVRAMRSAAAVSAGATLNTRVHPDVSLALRRASLQRKLDGVEPSTLRGILEEAVMPWLRANGYLP